MKKSLILILFALFNLNCFCQSIHNLLEACEAGDNLKVRELLLNGANVNAITSDGNSPLICAVEKGNLETIEILLEFHPKLDQTDKEGYSALHYACRACDFSIVELLIRNGAKFTKDRWGVSILDLAVQCNDDGKLAEYIMDAYHLQSTMPNTISSSLCFANSISIAKMLIAWGAKIDFIDSCGHNPLMSAIHSERVHIAEYFVSVGADVNIRDKKGDGWTPLLIAVREGLPEMVALLISKGADVKPQINRGPFKGMNALKMATILSSVDNENFVNRLPVMIQANFLDKGFKQKQEEIVRILKRAERK